MPRSPSSAVELPTALVSALGLSAGSVTHEDDAAWLERVRAGGLRTERVRLVTAAGDPTRASSALSSALGGDPSVAVFDAAVTPTGRLELLPFLREQAVAITAHRFGNPDPSLWHLKGIDR